MSKNNNQTIEEVLLSKIHPDENQPRKDFNATRLAELISSIKEHGILNPLVVERHPSGEYLLVDGERRYRASQELKLKKVPVIVIDPMTDTDRLIKQFHLQEQHEGWSAIEKAVAIGQLADQLGLGRRQMAKILSLPNRTIADYIGFWDLMSRQEFQKSEVPITMARGIVNVRNKAKKIYEDVYEKEFTTEKQKGLEQQIMSQIKSGEVRTQNDLTKLVDTFVAKPEMIDKFIKGRSTVTALYLDSNAKVAHHARLVHQNAGVMYTHIRQVMSLDGLELVQNNPEAVATLKRSYKELGALLQRID